MYRIPGQQTGCRTVSNCTQSCFYQYADHLPFRLLSIKLKYPGFFTTFQFASFPFTLYIIFVKAEFFLVRNFEETCLQPWWYASISLQLYIYRIIMQITLHSADFAGDKNVAFDFPDACLFGHPIVFYYQDFLSFASDFSFQHFNVGK